MHLKIAGFTNITDLCELEIDHRIINNKYILDRLRYIFSVINVILCVLFCMCCATNIYTTVSTAHTPDEITFTGRRNLDLS